MRQNRRVRWALFGLVLYLGFYVIGGVWIADGSLHPARRMLSRQQADAFRSKIEARNADMEDVSIKSFDGAILNGWMIHPQHWNGDAALLLHGLGDNRLGMTGYARLLLAHGFTVLLPDARGHGESGGSLVTYGMLERNDIRQWVDFLRMQVRPGCVYGVGESMGAAELLQSLAAGAQFCAVIAESSFSNFREIAYDRMGQPFHLGPWVGETILRPLVDVAFLRARWKYGLDMEQVSPEDAVANTIIPVLLIHGQIDSNIPVRHSIRIHSRDPKTALWEVPGADHCGAIAVAPQEFQSRLADWFRHTTASQ